MTLSVYRKKQCKVKVFHGCHERLIKAAKGGIYDINFEINALHTTKVYKMYNICCCGSGYGQILLFRPDPGL